MKNVKINNILFILILLLGIFFRFFQLGYLPSSLNWDEISHGYNAYSLINTGKDQWGSQWPIFNFRAYGDYPTTGNLYLTIPFIKVFGLNAFSIRLPHAILGVTFIIFSYLLTSILFKNKFISLFVMFLSAISPWTIFPFRGVFQSNLSQTFYLIALYYFFKSFNKKNNLLISSLFFSFSVFSYHNTRILVPLTLVFLFLFYFKEFKKDFSKYKKIYLTSILILAVFIIPNGLNLFSPESSARNRWVGIINPISINEINEQRRIFSGPSFLNRVINNKATYFFKTVSINFVNLLNPSFIFFRGSQNYQFNIPNFGLIYSIFLPFFYIGLIISLLKYRHLFCLFLISLLPSVITVGDFPSIRATSAVIFYFTFISLGLHFLYQKTKSNYLIIAIIFISLFQTYQYCLKYIDYNQKYSSAWQYGYEQTIDYLKSNYSQYDKIYFTKKYGEPHEFILFYWPWNPSAYLSDKNINWDYHDNWYWVNSFDKFVFVNDWEMKNITSDKTSKILIITSPDNINNKYHYLNTIKFLDNTPAFEIYEN